MVAKRAIIKLNRKSSLNLAKIHMVAKLTSILLKMLDSLNLAKIHMVAKPQNDFIT